MERGSHNMMDSSQHLLLFDGECGICSAFARFAQGLDRRGAFRIIPYQSVSEEQLREHGTSPAKCARRMHVISAQRKVYTGAFAVNHFFWQYFPWKVFVFAIYLVPVLLIVEIIGYELVARHRRRLSQWLGLTLCALPPQSDTSTR